MIVRGIIFSTPMVVALLKGQKHQTRRLLWSKREPTKSNARSSFQRWDGKTPWARVVAGDLLYVRETWAKVGPRAQLITLADYPTAKAIKWRSPIHMARKDSRITLEVVNVRLQRLHAISNHDARWEGVDCYPDYVEGRRDPFPVERYKALWAQLHGVESWDENPEVVALTFRPIMMNVDRYIEKEGTRMVGGLGIRTATP